MVKPIGSPNSLETYFFNTVSVKTGKAIQQVMKGAGNSKEIHQMMDASENYKLEMAKEKQLQKNIHYQKDQQPQVEKTEDKSIVIRAQQPKDYLIVVIFLKLVGGFTVVFSGACVFHVCQEFTNSADIARAVGSLFIFLVGHDCMIGGQNIYSDLKNISEISSKRHKELYLKLEDNFFKGMLLANKGVDLANALGQGYKKLIYKIDVA